MDRVGVLESLFERFAEGDFAASLPLLDADCVLVIPSEVPDAGIYVGHDGVNLYMSRFLEPWESLTIRQTSLRASGDTVLARVTQQGIGRSSQVPATLDYFQVWTFRGPKVIRIDITFDEARALESAGLAG